MLRTSLLSGLLLDVILALSVFARDVIHVARNWEDSQQRATSINAAIGTVAEWAFFGLVYAFAGALATYSAMRMSPKS